MLDLSPLQKHRSVYWSYLNVLDIHGNDTNGSQSFSDRVSLESPVLSPRTNLFQENSFNQILFIQKYRDLDLTQKRHTKWR